MSFVRSVLGVQVIRGFRCINIYFKLPLFTICYSDFSACISMFVSNTIVAVLHACQYIKGFKDILQPILYYKQFRNVLLKIYGNGKINGVKMSAD